MADSSFAEFDLLSGLNTGDYLVGYRNIRETRVEISDFINNTLAVSLSTMSDMAKSNSVYSSVNSNSSNWNSNYVYVNANAPAWNNTTSNVNANSPSWNSNYSTTNSNSAFWSNYVNYLSTTNVRLSSVTVADGLSALSLATDEISARRITLIHTPANDGTNPNLFIGETDINGTSGFNIFYDEIQNRLTVTSVFSGVSGAIVNIDRFGNASGPMLPYTVTLSKFFSAAGTKTGFFPAALSGMIPASEITSRIREGKGTIRASLLFVVSGNSTGTDNVRFEFAPNPSFSSNVSVFSNSMTNNPGSILKVFEGYVLDNFFVFPGNTSNPYSMSSNFPTIFGPYNNDLYFRAGFNVGNPVSNVWLSGGSISIIP